MAENPSYGQVDSNYTRRLATTPSPEDGPVWMLNLMKYRPVAEYADGRQTEISGEKAGDLYSPFEALAGVGAEVVFFADVEPQLLGDETTWDRVALVRYPTRRAFIEMQYRPDFKEKHVHKEAGMEKTIVLGLQPIDDPMLRQGSMVAPNWSDASNPPTEEDPSVVVLHVIRFHDGQADDEMVEYQNGASPVATEQGVHISGWFGVEGTVVGDGRPWHQARFNAFPSKKAFMEVVFDPDRLAAQKEHRETAIADTYTMILRPRFDHIFASVHG